MLVGCLYTKKINYVLSIILGKYKMSLLDLTHLYNHCKPDIDIALFLYDMTLVLEYQIEYYNQL